MKTIIASTMILLLLLIPIIASGSALTTLGFGGKSGDWMEYNLQGAFSSSSEEQERIEFLNVSGTNVTVHATVYTPNLTEMDKTETFNLTTQDDFSLKFLTARLYFIPGGLSQGDSVYLGSMLGTRNITGETTRSYAGTNRKVIYANFSDMEGSNYIFYWDKQTGVLTEGAKTLGIASEGVTVSATNMWGIELAWLLWISVIVAIALGVLSSRKSFMKKLRRKQDAQPPLTKVCPLAFTPQKKGKC